MKKTIVTVITFVLHTILYAQKPFPQMLNAKFTLNAEWKTISDDVSRVLAGDLEDIGMFSCIDGKEIWRINFKQKYGKKSCTDWRWLEEKGLVKIEFKGDKKGTTEVFYIDDKTTEAVADEKQRDVPNVKTNMVRKDMLVLNSPNVTIKAMYEKKGIFNGSAAKGNKRKVTIECSGDYRWNTDFDASLVASLCDNSMGYVNTFFGNQLSLSASENKLFVIYEGLTCIDITTGNILWQTSFDNSYFDFGLFKSVQTVGRADVPLQENNNIYITDLSKGNRCLKKLDATTGNVVWKADEFEKDDVIPQSLIIGDVVLLRFGGEIITQSYIPNANNAAASVCKTELKMTGPFGVKAYDKQTGKILWSTKELKLAGDKFSSSISNMLSNEKHVIVASDKHVFCIDAQTGGIVFKVENKTLDIGKPYRLYFYQNDIMIEAEEGVARIGKADGKIKFATNTGKCLYTQFVGDAYFVWTGKELADMHTFMRVDIETGAILGVQKNTYRPWFTANGDEFVKFETGKILRFKTK